jgi:hypothetical protein
MTFGKFNGQNVIDELEAVGDKEADVMIRRSLWTLYSLCIT